MTDLRRRWNLGITGAAIFSMAAASCLAAAPTGERDSIGDGGGSGSSGSSGSAMGDDEGGSGGSGATSGTSSGASTGTTSGSSADDASSGTSSGGGDAGGEGGAVSASVDVDWAQWPIANSFTDTTLPRPMSFKDNGNGTVTDQVTGLVWQQTVSGVMMKWSSAATYCAGINKTGVTTTWRLPTFIELVSMLDYSDTGTIDVDTTYFPNTPTDTTPFWTATPDDGDPGDGYAVSVYMTDGTSELDDETTALYVRCVTSSEVLATPTATDSAYPPGRYTVSTGQVKDNLTGLTWQDPPGSDGYSFTQAASACTSGWRVPTIKELASIVDIAYPDSAFIDDHVFTLPAGDSSVGGNYYWSSTPVPTTSNQKAYYADFDTLEGYFINWGTTSSSDHAYVRCVK